MGINAHLEHVSLSDTHKILAAHKHMGGVYIFQPEDSKSWIFTPIPNKIKIVLSLDGILKTTMITKVNFKRSFSR